MKFIYAKKYEIPAKHVKKKYNINNINSAWAVTIQKYYN